MSEYTNALADVTAEFAFDTAAMTPRDYRNKTDAGFAVAGESLTVPSSAPYIVCLDFVPLEQSSITLNDGTQDLALVRYGEAPAELEAAVSMDLGLIEFNSAKAGATITATYTARGSAILSHDLNKIQKEILAVQSWINGYLSTFISSIKNVLPFTFFGAAPATSAGEEWEIRVGRVGATTQLANLKIIGAQPFGTTGATTVRISKTGVGASSNYIEATVGQSAYRGSASAGTLTITGVETVYAYIQQSGGHQNIQCHVDNEETS